MIKRYCDGCGKALKDQWHLLSFKRGLANQYDWCGREVCEKKLAKKHEGKR